MLVGFLFVGLVEPLGDVGEYVFRFVFDESGDEFGEEGVDLFVEVGKGLLLITI